MNTYIKMKELNFDSQLEPIKFPASFFELQKLPKNPFYLDSGGYWGQLSIRAIRNVILYLLCKKHIKAKFVYKQKRFFFNLITWKYSQYEFNSTIDTTSIQPVSWLENQILSVVQTNEGKDIRSIMRVLLESIVGMRNNYFTPGKIIFSKIIIESDTDLWLYKPSYFVAFWDNSKTINKIELIITEDVKDQIRFEKEKFENGVKELFFENPELEKMDTALKKIIKSELEKKGRDL